LPITADGRTDQSEHAELAAIDKSAIAHKYRSNGGGSKLRLSR
jgi:hypothetical protein